MIHLGDITKINGAAIPAVDCITGGSPCQDLSIAGKRAGLAGDRSGLYMEQVRVVREMREHDRADGRTGWAIRPRYMVWENVPGAFSSGSPKGADFAAVLEEILKICEPGAGVHVRIPGGGWTKSGCYYAEDGTWSVAWRVHDAQFWGVPQRRKRIALVADFGGLTAPEVLFERKGMSGDTDPGRAQEEAPSKTAGGSPDCAVWCIKGNAIDRDTAQNGGWARENVSYTLDATDRHGVAVMSLSNRGYFCGSKTETLRAESHGAIPMVGGFKYHQGAAAGGIGYEPEKAPTLDSGKCPAVFDARWNGTGKIVPTLTGDHQNRVTDYTAIICGLDGNNGGHIEMAGCLRAHETGGSNECCLDHTGYVRRLTPLECERLQGYPDGWTDIGSWVDSNGRMRETTDTARYKALGNSIALPFWFWLLRRISAQYERPATLGSLFDGIGGFPLCWERCNGPGTALWASEIDQFPIAVTKKRFDKEALNDEAD